MKKIIENIIIFQKASLIATKKALLYLKDEMNNQFDLKEDNEGKIYIDQNCGSILNALYAIESDNNLANFFRAIFPFFQTLETNRTYCCISQAYTVYLLKILKKHNILTLNELFKTHGNSLSCQRRNFGLNNRQKESNMYYISFTKERNLNKDDIVWLIEILKTLNVQATKVNFDENTNQIKITVKRDFKITKKNIQKTLIILRAFLIELKASCYDITETSIHYYKILKKCQIMMK